MRDEARQRWILLILLAATVVVTAGCDSACKTSPEHAQIDEATPQLAVELAQLQAMGSFFGAHKAGFDAAFRQVEARLHRARQGEYGARPSHDGSKVVAIIFSANMHGEFMPSGSAANPRGGLARRHTLIEAYESSADEAESWWGPLVPENKAVFVADGGDLFFSNPLIDQAEHDDIDEARARARHLIDGLNLRPPDVAGVGEHDLVLGLDELLSLASRAKFPLVSANLRRVDGSAPFKGHVVVRREGKSVAFIGLTKAAVGIKNYYDTRQVAVGDPLEAYRREVSQIGDVDAVVLLSSLGVDATRELVELVREEELPIHAALISNTNRLTATPVWAAGIPLAEPLSRGQYLGRLELFLGAEMGKGTPAYANALDDPGDAIRAYRRSWASYLKARQARDEGIIELLGLRMSVAESVEAAKESKNSRIEYLEREQVTLNANLAAAGQGFLAAASGIDELESMLQFGEGSDWAALRIIEIEPAIDEDTRVRAILDKALPNLP
ncbi:MAG: hypothetical protein ACNA8W_03765 [Bradymonadaceae bacterium]